ncbi:gametogenetin-like [Schistocerca americana]|uniref:gametogenetin-like n=1 Tax=Schistocerca americana TaxID=7009 RepID=UPI001F4FEAFD|nr:gametogenetin-like [Schistocerca americana]
MATLEELQKTVEELLARNTRLESELQARTTCADAVANLADRVHDALTTAPSTAAAAAYDSVPPPPWRPAPPAPASDADLHQLVQNLTAQVAALSTQVDRLARSQQEGSARRSGSRPGDRRRGSRSRQRSNSRSNEDLFTDDTPSASGQTEPAPGAAGDAQLQPAVIAPPRAPPSTTPRQLVRPPGPRPPQAHRSPPPQPPADYVTRAARRVRFKRPCCRPDLQLQVPSAGNSSRAFVTAPGPAFASYASAASGVEAGSAPAPAYLIRVSVELRTSRTTPSGLSVVAPGPAFEFRRRQREDTPTARSPVRRADVTGRRPSDADRPPPKLPHCHHAVHEL